VFTPANGGEKKTMEVFNYGQNGGCGMAMYNTVDVIL
jgi:hypothetical protein